MTKQYSVSVDWTRIHEACQALDHVRGDIGRACGCDAFGGTYNGAHYESRGLVGLLAIAKAADILMDSAWTTIHHGHAAVSAAADAVPVATYWAAVDAPGRMDVICRSARGAKSRARRYGGRAVQRVNEEATAARRDTAIKRAVEHLQRAVRVALALHDLRVALAETGIAEYRPSSVICGNTGDRLMVIGLRWLVGEREQDGGTPMAVVHKFLDRGIEGLAAH